MYDGDLCYLRCGRVALAAESAVCGARGQDNTQEGRAETGHSATVAPSSGGASGAAIRSFVNSFNSYFIFYFLLVNKVKKSYLFRYILRSIPNSGCVSKLRKLKTELDECDWTIMLKSELDQIIRLMFFCFGTNCN